MKTYFSPQMEVVVLDSCDVLCLSGLNFQGATLESFDELETLTM
jgi:hypothetical protein